MSTFDGDAIFDSGPHRFAIGARGEQLASAADIAGDPSVPGNQAIGPLDAEVIVRGRLVAADAREMQDLLDAIAAKLTHPPTTGTLVDPHGTEYAEMAFISFTPADRVDRGASLSMAYSARFVKFGGFEA